MNKVLYIVRGIPGSGKSTLAYNLVGSSEMVCEADKYFMVNGEYKFDATQLKEAHGWCQGQVEGRMANSGFDSFNNQIAVSNTFTQEWEMQPYIDMAKKYGYTVFSIIVENRHGGINVHGVPEEVLTKMKNRFEIKL